MNGWIGVDLDGTLAVYDHWRGEDHIGSPIPAMVDRILAWRDQGMEVRIFTARASANGRSLEQRAKNIHLIQQWCEANLGEALPVTSDKDFGMIVLWDDRCRQVEANTGKLVPSPGHSKSCKTCRRNGSVRCLSPLPCVDEDFTSWEPMA